MGKNVEKNQEAGMAWGGGVKAWPLPNTNSGLLNWPAQGLLFIYDHRHLEGLLTWNTEPTRSGC